MLLNENQYLRVRSVPGGLDFDMCERTPLGIVHVVKKFVPTKKLLTARRQAVQLGTLLDFMHLELENLNNEKSSS
jgi:hypothetical protein